MTKNKWPMVKLGDLYRKTKSLDPRKNPDSLYTLYSIPSYDNGQPETVTGSEVGSSKSILQGGDVLISKIVPHIQRAWVLGNEPNAIGSSEWIVLNDERFDPDYLRFYLLSPFFHKRFLLTVAGVGGSLSRARPKAAAKIEIPLPPLEEQKRIAGILSKSVSDIHVADHQISLVADKLFSPLFSEISRVYPKVAIGDIASVSSGLTPSRKVEEYYGGDIPWIKTDLVRGESITQATEFITQKALEETACTIHRPGCSLIAMYGQGATRGRAGILRIPATTNQACAVIDCHEPKDDLFVFNMLKQSYESLRALGRGGTQPNLNLSIVKNFEIPYPPEEERTRLMAMFASLEETVYLLRKRREALLELHRSLCQRLLT